MKRHYGSILVCAALLATGCNSGINIRGRVSLASGAEKPSSGILSVVASPQNHDPGDLNVPNEHAAVHEVEWPYAFEFTEIEGPIDSTTWVLAAAVSPMDGDGSRYVGISTFNFDCDDDHLNCEANEVEVVLEQVGE